MTNYVQPSWLPPADCVIDYGNGRIGPVMWHWADEGTNLVEIAEREGFEVRAVLCDENDEATKAYENGGDSDEILKGWKPPEELDGGWRLASKDDTEDGLLATYLRKINR